jgi:hypothetical protein
VKVAKDTGFFGRRRELQRSLQALADPGDYYGVYLYGIGGYGRAPSPPASAAVTRL